MDLERARVASRVREELGSSVLGRSVCPSSLGCLQTSGGGYYLVSSSFGYLEGSFDWCVSILVSSSFSDLQRGRGIKTFPPPLVVQVIVVLRSRGGCGR
jgi:hypothetical protein